MCRKKRVSVVNDRRRECCNRIDYIHRYKAPNQKGTDNGKV